jgi:DNA repair photolyase
MIAVNEIQVNSYLTKTRIPAGDYVINPYIGCPHRCVYCYADFMRRFTNHHEKWGDFLDVKRCAKKINVRRLEGKKVVFCSVTDAYNPFEKKYEITRNILKQFHGSGVSIEILTKSALVLRDIDIFRQIPNIRIGISLNTLDDTIRKKLEPGASNIQSRLDAIKRLTGEGFETYIFLSPIFPGITDFRAILLECKGFTNMFYFENLNLRPSFKSAVFSYIAQYHKHLLPVYHEIYTDKLSSFWTCMEKEIDMFCKKHRIRYGSYFYHEKIRK